MSTESEYPLQRLEEVPVSTSEVDLGNMPAPASASLVMGTPTGITVEPNMVEEVVPGFYDKLNRERVPERRTQKQNGWTARRGSLQAWSTSRDAALTMLGFMEGRKSAEEPAQ